MLLLKAVLHNFRQYGKREEILFPSTGLTGVLGKNGAGKSTLFNAVCWALYGKVKDVNKEFIMNAQADKKEACYVELYFAFQGTLYHVKRDIKKTNECYIKTNDGTPFAIGTSNLTSFVEENLFKMDYNAFCSCYYAEQDDFDNLVKLTPAKRVQTVSKLLRIDSIDRASDITRKEFRALKVEVEEARKHLRDESSLNEQKRTLKESIRSRKLTLKVLEKEMHEQEAQYKDKLVQKATGENAYQLFRDLTHRMDHATEKIETLTIRSLDKSTQELTELRRFQKRFDEIKGYKEIYPSLLAEKEAMSVSRVDFREKLKLTSELQALEKEVSAYMQEYKVCTTEMKAIGEVETALLAKESSLASLQAEWGQQKEAFQEKSYELKTKMTQMTELKEMKGKFEEMGTDSPCPTCERPLGEHYEDKMEHIQMEVSTIVALGVQVQTELKAMDQIIHGLQEQIKQTQQEIVRLREAQTKKHTLNERVQLIKQELTIRKARLDKLQQAYGAVKNVQFDEEKFTELMQNLAKATGLYEEVLRIENVITKIPSVEATVEEVTAEIANMRVFLAQLVTEKTTLAFDEVAYHKLDAEVQQTLSLLQQQQTKQTETLFAIQSLEKDILFIEEKLAENKAMSQAIQVKEEKMALLGKLDEAYKRYKSDILAKLAPTLSEIMSDDIDVMTNGKYNQIELDEEYNIFIYRQKEKHPLSFYSGGERKLAALCQRLAISGLLVSQTGQANFDMLAMDEVFGSMDNERQDSIVEMLRNLNGKFPQILVVTHSENVKELFDHVLEIKQNGAGNSTFEWLTEWDSTEVEEMLATFALEEEAS